MNFVWLWSDYAVFMLLFAASLYDNTVIALILCIIDIVVIALPWFILLRDLRSITVNAVEATRDIFGDFDITTTAGICVFTAFIIITPLVIFITAPWTLFIFIYIEQYSKCNILPFNCHATSDKSQCFRYRLYKWIKNGNNTEERGKRLYCINSAVLKSKPDHELMELHRDRDEIPSVEKVGVWGLTFILIMKRRF